MAYCTLDDIKKNIPGAVILQLTNDDGVAITLAMLETLAAGGDMSGYEEDEQAAATAALSKIDEAISSADGEIDGYLATRYPVPLDPVPALISKFSADIAIYNLYSRVAETIPETRSDRYKNAIRTLEKISEGKIKLGAEVEPPAKATTTAQVTGPARLFTRETLKDM